MGTFGVFATGFLMRPLGGLVFGHIGDRVGRKRALELSVLLMAVSTTIIGLLPTYAAIGVWAPLLLTLIRLFQGLSLGGEYVGSMSFLAERRRRAAAASSRAGAATSVVLGSLLGSGTAAVCTGLLTDSQLASWGWRDPVPGRPPDRRAGLLAADRRRREPPFPRGPRERRPGREPDRRGLAQRRPAILTILGLTTLSSSASTSRLSGMATWLSRINHPPIPKATELLIASTIALLALLLLTPLMALVSDRVGRAADVPGLRRRVRALHRSRSSGCSPPAPSRRP